MDFILDNNDKYILGQGPNMDEGFLENGWDNFIPIIGMEGANDRLRDFYNYIAAGFLGTILVIFLYLFYILVLQKLIIRILIILIGLYLYVFIFNI